MKYVVYKHDMFYCVWHFSCKGSTSASYVVRTQLDINTVAKFFIEVNVEPMFRIKRY